jgi:hypothetical protein
MLIALLFSMTPAALSVPKKLGYPIFVSQYRGQCSYTIQDMIMREPMQITDWMRQIPLTLRVDIVADRRSANKCVALARAAVRQASKSRIVVRHGSKADYGRTGPPRP